MQPLFKESAEKSPSELFQQSYSRQSKRGEVLMEILNNVNVGMLAQVKLNTSLEVGK